ncbi:alpha/beta hydrolase [Priestia endophytica]|uniref:alpha/beta hydrolase n=1 Tax=Priestia endophytica TaxID=135735 RepID=UPI002280BD1A|nr:alpha/beta hydrolase-fold protein [Priestia endophytica]MCY8230568.1 alpha/beta hydrolase-fold protein [Priestia endophytica]
MDYRPGKIEELTFYSEELQEEMTLLLYLPKTYSPLYKYSLLIAQDGKDYFMFGKLSRALDELSEEEEIEPTIAVGIPYKSVDERRKMYHPDGEKVEQYVRFLAHELLSYLDDLLPTHKMGGTRTLIGDSLGGTVSLLTALQYPHTFNKVVAQSPLVNETLLNKVADFASPNALHIYHTIGLQETEVKTTDKKIADFLTPNRELYQLLTTKGFSYFYEEMEGNHTWRYWQKDIPRALRKMLC